MISKKPEKHFTSTNPAPERELIHRLNQRYKQEWDRAERLQAELNDIHQSKTWRVFSWLRTLRKKLIRPTPGEAKTSIAPMRALEPASGPPTEKVSILIPFRDGVSLLRNLLRSLRGTTYRRYEILLIDNGSTCRQMWRFLQRLQEKKRIRVMSAAGPFDFARLCNRGAKMARGHFLLFLNNDMEVLSPDWLEQLLLLGQQTRVGVTGATLLYPDGTIQHAGLFPAKCAGGWTHLYRGCPGDHLGDQGELWRVREVPAVTGACLLIRRGLFEELGGFSERYPIIGNDVDLCCRVRQRGLAVGITPYARLLHYESLSRGYSREVDADFGSLHGT